MVKEEIDGRTNEGDNNISFAFLKKAWDYIIQSQLERRQTPTNNGEAKI